MSIRPERVLAVYDDSLEAGGFFGHAQSLVEAAETAANLGARVMLVITCEDDGARATAVLEALGYTVERVETRP